MRVFVSADMEGVAGIVDWAQCRHAGPGEPSSGGGYVEGCRLLLGEVNAAVDGAVAAGADQVVVCDAHGAMANLAPDRLAGDASYVSGRMRPGYMMSGLDETFDAIVFLGYHGSMPLASTLSHTYNPAVVSDARIGGVRCGESGINALAAAAHGVAVVLVTGDQHVGPEAAPFCPGIVAAEVKQSLNRTSAVSLHPDRARAVIQEATRAALTSGAATAPTDLGDLEVDVLTTDMAATAATVRGVERTGERTVTIGTGDPMTGYLAFTAMITATRGMTI